MSFWTDERVGQLRRLWDEGRSAAQIAVELGASSRNAVIGKAHRLGVGLRKPSFVTTGEPRPRPNNSGGGIVRAIRAKRKTPFQPKAPEVEQAPLNAPSAIEADGIFDIAPDAAPHRSVTLMELDATTCRWPLTEDTRDPDFRYCGDPVRDGYPYCACHAKRAFNRAPQMSAAERERIRLHMIRVRSARHKGAA